MVTTEPNLRIPALLMPSYLRYTSTEEGKTAEKRVRVFCGICKETRYYSIHRGVTKVAGVVVACEACRHYYQKFKRQPCILRCKSDGSCYVLGDNSKSRCKACWIAHLLRRCPFSDDIYQHLLGHLPPKIKGKMSSSPPKAGDIPEEELGALGLEVLHEKKWVDIKEILPEEPEEEEQPVKQEEEEEQQEEEISSQEQENTTPETESYLEPPETLRWWMEEEGSRYTHSSTSTALPCYTTEDTESSSSGLTPLTPLQPAASGLTTLTPLQPSHHHPHQNGFHHSDSSSVMVKQEFDSWQDGESEEAKLFRKISVKREFITIPSNHADQRDSVDLHVSPYFTHLDMENHLDIGLLSQDLGAGTGTIVTVTGGVPAPVSLPVATPASQAQEKTDAPKPKKRKRKPKIKMEENGPESVKSNSPGDKNKRSAPEVGTDGQSLPSPSKQRKKLDRFNGVPEEEVAKKTLPDHLGPNLDIVIIGINPGLTAAHRGHHYAGPGNHFWKCMYLSGLIPEPFTADDDFRLLDYGIGFTNIVARTTRGSADLTRTEIKQGAKLLQSKIRRYHPLIAVFNGKGIYEIYSGKKEFCFGRQPEKIEGTNTHIWVMPSSSARCAQLPRALDKVPFYSALRKYRDFLKGRLSKLDEAEVVFSNVKLSNVRPQPKTEPKIEPKAKCSDPHDPSPTTATQTHKPAPHRTKGQKSPKKKR